MDERENKNVFRFSLYQGNILLCEKMFDADQFNPFTRYAINIRDILPRAITKLQKTLSKRSYDVLFEVGNVTNNNGGMEEKVYDLYSYNQKIINHYPKEWRQDLCYNPQSVVQQIEQKTIRGVHCKIGLYINENPIVEREFFVDGFNPVARYSLDILYAVIDITEQIFEKIKKTDIKNMWDDYDLINYKGLSFNQIRELPAYKRDELLRKLNRN